MMDNREIRTSRRGRGFWALVALTAALCVVSVGHVPSLPLDIYDLISDLFAVTRSFGLFCILFEIETLMSARKLGIPEEDDRCRKVSYVLSVVLSFIFPAVVALFVMIDHLNMPAIVLAMMLSYGVFAGVAFIMLLPFGNDCKYSIIFSKGHRNKGTGELDDTDDLMAGTEEYNNWLGEKRTYGPDRLTIIDDEGKEEEL